MEDFVINRFTKLVPEDKRKEFHDHILNKLKEAKSKGGSSQTCDFKIKAKEIENEPKGIAFEIKTFKEDKYSQILNNYACDGDMLVTAAVNTVSAEATEQVRTLFEQFKPMIEEAVKAHPAPGATTEVQFRTEGTRVNIDLVAKETTPSNTGLSYQDVFNFRFLLGTEIGFDDFLKEGADQELIKKLLSAEISFNGVASLVGVLSDIYVNDLPKFGYVRKDSTKNFIKKIVAFLLPCLISANVSFIYSATDVANSNSKDDKIIGGMSPQEAVAYSRQSSKEMAQAMVKPTLEGMQLLDAFKALNLDVINVILASPKDKSGVIITLRLPGITNFANEMLK